MNMNKLLKTNRLIFHQGQSNTKMTKKWQLCSEITSKTSPPVHQVHTLTTNWRNPTPRLSASESGREQETAGYLSSWLTQEQIEYKDNILRLAEAITAYPHKKSIYNIYWHWKAFDKIWKISKDFKTINSNLNEFHGPSFLHKPKNKGQCFRLTLHLFNVLIRCVPPGAFLSRLFLFLLISPLTLAYFLQLVVTLLYSH